MTTPTSIYGKTRISETISIRKLNVGLNKGEYPCLIFDLLRKKKIFRVIYKTPFSLHGEIIFWKLTNKKLQPWYGMYIVDEK